MPGRPALYDQPAAGASKPLFRGIANSIASSRAYALPLPPSIVYTYAWSSCRTDAHEFASAPPAVIPSTHIEAAAPWAFKGPGTPEEFYDAEAHIPAQPPPPRQNARLSFPHEDQGWCRSTQPPPRQGSPQDRCLCRLPRLDQISCQCTDHAGRQHPHPGDASSHSSTTPSLSGLVIELTPLRGLICVRCHLVLTRKVSPVQS